jgi:hypothetical protein
MNHGTNGRILRNFTLSTLLGAAGASTGIAQAATGDAAGALSPRRQLVLCMNKAMLASRTVSYNQAAAACKARLTPKAPALASADAPRAQSGTVK